MTHSFSLFGFKVTVEREHPSGWGANRFEVWVVTDTGQLRHYLPEGMPKFSRSEALRSVERLSRVLCADEHLEIVDLRSGEHEQPRAGS